MNRQERRAEESRRSKEKRVILQRTDGGPPQDVTVEQAYALATKMYAAGQAVEAEVIYRHLLVVEPDHHDALTNLGAITAMDGRFDLAIALLEKVLQEPAAKNPVTAEAWLNYGVALRGAGRIGEAVEAYGRGLEIDPAMAALHYNLAGIMLGFGELDISLQGFRQAVRLDPADQGLWRGLGNCLAAQINLPDDPALADELAVCLATQGVAAQPLILHACAYLKRQPEFSPLIAAARENRLMIDGDAMQALNARLVAACLIYEVIRDIDLERLFTQARACLLLDAELRNTGAATFLFALAMQCDFNEYVYDEAPQESTAVEALIARLNAADLSALSAAPSGPLARDIAILAAYRPLNSLPLSGALSRHACGNPMAALLARQIHAPQVEENLRGAIKSLSDVSDVAAAQDALTPYPRWCNTGYGSPLSLGMTLVSRFPHLQGRLLRIPNPPRVLIAGCGTGLHAIAYANSIHGARVTAIDPSLNNLAYAKRMAGEFGVRNIEFLQGGMKQLRGAGLKFDFIHAPGQLHQMDDPLEGMRILTDCLNPSGVLSAILYSENARRPIAAAREYVAERAYPSTLAGIRECRNAIMGLPDTHPVKTVTSEGSDFYTLSGCRALLFRSGEHSITCLQRQQMIDDLGLEFLGFESIDPGLRGDYAARFPDDPAMTNLAHWHDYEGLFPDSLSGAGPIWLLKRDGS